MDLVENEWFIEAPWGRVSIIAWGSCLDPPVLLCHGRVDSAATFRPLVKHLPRNFYYIGVELPGNGKSDRFPPGLMINVYDLLYVLRLVVRHFRWKNFAYIGHSLGALLGKLYNLSFPMEMTKVVELESRPSLILDTNDFAEWYHTHFSQYFLKYDTYNASKDTAPIYSKDKAIDMLKRNRGLSDEAAATALERLVEHVGHDKIRFTFDQRMKLVTHPPFTIKQELKLYTAITTPTLAIVAENSVKLGYYEKSKYILDEALYPAKNYKVFVVKGNHDFQLMHPEVLAPYITAFLRNGLDALERRAKL